MKNLTVTLIVLSLSISLQADPYQWQRRRQFHPQQNQWQAPQRQWNAPQQNRWQTTPQRQWNAPQQNRWQTPQYRQPAQRFSQPQRLAPISAPSRPQQQNRSFALAPITAPSRPQVRRYSPPPVSAQRRIQRPGVVLTPIAATAPSAAIPVVSSNSVFDADRRQRDDMLKAISVPDLTSASSSSSNSVLDADRRQRDDMLKSVSVQGTTSSSSSSGINTLMDAAAKADTQERDFMLKATFATTTTSTYWENSSRVSQYWKEGNYTRALGIQRSVIKEENLDVNLASNYVSLAMLQWNCNYKASARDSMQKAINVMKTGTNIGNSSCEEKAVAFLEKMKSGQLPDTFTYDDTCTDGVLGYIMAAPREAFDKKMKAEGAKADTLALYASSMANSYRMQGASQARRAKLSAASEYQKATNQTFSPTSPPASGTKEREVWEKCKKVYDIFE